VNGYASHNRNAFGFTASAGKLIKSQVLEIVDAGPYPAHSTGKNTHLLYLERPGSGRSAMPFNRFRSKSCPSDSGID
jgi:hypothetical protein